LIISITFSLNNLREKYRLIAKTFMNTLGKHKIYATHKDIGE